MAVFLGSGGYAAVSYVFHIVQAYDNYHKKRRALEQRSSKNAPPPPF